MYSAPLSGLCPSRPGADFTLARDTMKASGGRDLCVWGGVYTSCVSPETSRSIPTMCYLEISLLSRFTSVRPSLLN